MMQWSSAVSTRNQGAEALAEVVGKLAGPKPDLVLLFMTHHHRNSAEELLKKIQAAYPGARIFGCAGGGVAGGGREVEEGPGLSLTLAQLPDVEIESWHLGEGSDLSAWDRPLPEQDPAILVLADPATLPVDALLRSLDRRWPGCPKVGGLASGGQAPGENLLFLDGDVHRDGAVVLSLWGDIQLRSVVAQGARPLTEPMTVTRGHYTRIYELDGKPVVQVLEELFGRLGEEERELFRGAPLVGLSDMDSPRRGDWLVRNLTGLSRKEGTVMVGALVQEGQKVAFHLRDRETAQADLAELLARGRQHLRGQPAAATLLFSCMGRGSGLFGELHYESREIQRILGGAGPAGFFCGGEIGPVHGRSWLHGFTSSIGIVSTRGWS